MIIIINTLNLSVTLQVRVGGLFELIQKGLLYNSTYLLEKYLFFKNSIESLFFRTNKQKIYDYYY